MERLLPKRIPQAGPDRLPVCSVLSCTTWGLSCLPGYPWSGELLPRLFTLTQPAEAGRAVYFLRHFPSPGHFSRVPRLSPGMLSCGVRTFLWPPKEPAIISGLFRREPNRWNLKLLRENERSELTAFRPRDENPDNEKRDDGEDQHDIPGFSGTQGRINRPVAEIKRRDTQHRKQQGLHKAREQNQHDRLRKECVDHETQDRKGDAEKAD